MVCGLIIQIKLSLFCENEFQGVSEFHKRFCFNESTYDCVAKVFSLVAVKFHERIVSLYLLNLLNQILLVFWFLKRVYYLVNNESCVVVWL